MVQNKIVRLLKKCDGYYSGEDISQQLNISRAGVWKNVQELRKDGYDIVAVPHLGFRTELGQQRITVHQIGAVEPFGEGLSDVGQ